MNKLFAIFSKSQHMQARSRVHDLKARLDWGEPALTIIDIRNHELFNEGHVVGAISLPAAELVSRAIASLEFDRDLYVYGSTDEEATAAADELRAAGYEKVSVLRGGVAAWKAVGFPIEAITAIAA